MKYIYTCCIALVVGIQPTTAQTYTVNWATSFITNWLTGLLTGTANNIGSSTVNATVNITSSQGNSAFNSFNSYTSPTVSASPLTTQLGAIAPNIAVGCNFNNRNQYTDIAINFNSLVQKVTFNIADIDKNLYTWDYFDQVTVTGRTATGTTAIPTLRKLVTSSDFVVISGNTATANTNFWDGGNSASNIIDQRATVIVDFGTAIIDQVTVRYGNHSSAQNNPDEQAIAIGNIAFERVVPLPLTLLSFNGTVNNNAVLLSWLTAQEDNLDQFIIEKSTDGINWTTLTSVKAAGNSSTTKEYRTTDAVAVAVNYYRLKQVDKGGNSTYSNIIRIKGEGADVLGIKLYPNPVTNATTIIINSESKVAAHLKMYNQAGVPVQQLQRTLVAGSNNIPLPGINTLAAGLYIIAVEDETGKKLGAAKFIKQ